MTLTEKGAVALIFISSGCLLGAFLAYLVAYMDAWELAPYPSVLMLCGLTSLLGMVWGYLTYRQ